MAYATERAKMLFGSYRRTDANDPDVYVASIAAVLAMYDTDIIREVTDPRTGVGTSEKHLAFMPNAGELKVYCEGMAARRERIQRLGALSRPNPVSERLAPPEPRPGDLANVFVPSSNPRYERFVAWSATADPRLWRMDNERGGIWVGYNQIDQGKPIPKQVVTNAEPRALRLSEAALKVMRDLDAERNRNLPADQQDHSDVG